MPRRRWAQHAWAAPLMASAASSSDSRRGRAPAAPCTHQGVEPLRKSRCAGAAGRAAVAATGGVSHGAAVAKAPAGADGPHAASRDPAPNAGHAGAAAEHLIARLAGCGAGDGVDLGNDCEAEPDRSAGIEHGTHA